VDDLDHSVDNLELRLDDADIYTMFTLPSSKVDPIKIVVKLDNTPILMELDTGASLSIISYDVYKILPLQPILQPKAQDLYRWSN